MSFDYSFQSAPRLLPAHPCPTGACQIFATRDRLAWRLPRITSHHWSTAAEQIQVIVEHQWHVKIVVLDLLGGPPDREAMAIIELLYVHRSSLEVRAGS